MGLTSNVKPSVSIWPFPLSASRWWIIAALILVGGALPRYVGYRFQLPYLDELDEAGHFWNTMSWRGVYPVDMHEVGYPPGIFFVDGLAQSLTERSTHDWIVNHIAEAVALARLWAIGANLLTALLIGLIARHMLGTRNGAAGDIGGWLAMIVWLLPSDIIFHSVYALPAAWVILFDALALYATLVSLERHQPQWAVISVLAALAAIIFKYPEVPMLIFGLLVTILHLRQPTRRWIVAFVFEIAAIALTAYWLLVVYRAAQITSWQIELTSGSSTNFARLITLGLYWRVGQIAAHQLGFDLVVWCAIFLVGTWLVWRNSRGRLAWLLLLAFTIGHVSIALLYYYWDNLLPRYVVPASIGVALVIAVAAVEFGVWANQRLRMRWGLHVILLLLCLIWLAPQTVITYQFASARTVPETRGALQTWAFINMGEGAVITTMDTHKVFNREWAGYDGATRFTTQKSLFDRPLVAWQNDIYRFAVFGRGEVDALLDHPAYAANLLLLKHFPPGDFPGKWSGPEIYVYRLWPMQHLVQVDFGAQFRLVGYDQATTSSASALKPGDTLTLTLYWRSLRQPTDNENVFVHLYPDDQVELLAQADGAPGGAKRPTITWQDTTETIVGSPLALQVPKTLKPGCYRLVVGLYNYQTLQRLTAGDQLFAVLKTFCIGEVTL